MIKDLAPLVRRRAVLFTVGHVEDDQFRVNVIPKKVTEAENDAMITPVSVTGAVEDLDRMLPQTLLHFASSHLELKNTLEQATAEMEEASKVATAEARKKSGSQVNTRMDATAISSNPAAAPEPPVPAKVEAPKPASLFHTPPEHEPLNAGDARVSDHTWPIGAESQIDEDSSAVCLHRRPLLLHCLRSE